MHNRPQVIEIFDRSLVRQNRSRAARQFPNYDFLLKAAGKNLLDRLDDIKREFPDMLQIGGRGFDKDLLAEKSGIKNITICDLAEGFLEKNTAGIVADEEFLPFAGESFNLVISNLGLHTVNDLPGTLIQINNTLKPDGLFLGAMFGGGTLFELRKSMMQAEMNIKGGASPHIFPFANKQQIGGLLQRARFALPVVDSEEITVTYDNVRQLMRDLRGMGEGSALKDRSKTTLGKAMLGETERIYAENFAEEDGRLRATFEIIFLTGWAPHEGQQKPLKPGSAKNRLADALKAKEIKT